MRIDAISETYAMTDHLPHRQNHLLIPFNILARNAVNDAVSAITALNRLQNPTEKTVAGVVAASEHNERQARAIAVDLLAAIERQLENSGLGYFDQCFLGNRNNAGMHAAYRNAREQYPAELDTALAEAWTNERRDWKMRAALPGDHVRRGDGDAAPLLAIQNDATEPTEAVVPIVRDARGGLVARAIAKIASIVTRR